MRLPAVTAAAVLLAALPARADSPPSATPPRATGSSGVAYAPAPGVVRVRRDPAVALGLSLGVTATGAALMAAAGAAGDSDLGDGLAITGLIAILIGPTTGHWYADRIGNPGLGVRAVSASVGVVAFSGLALCAFDGIHLSPEDAPDDDGDSCGIWAAVAVGASLVYAGGTVYEIADAPRAARAYNQRYGLDVTLAPTAIRAGDGTRAPGLALAGHF